MHPHHSDAKRSHAARLRAVAGDAAKIEYPNDKAERLASGSVGKAGGGPVWQPYGGGVHAGDDKESFVTAGPGRDAIHALKYRTPPTPQERQAQDALATDISKQFRKPGD